VRATLSALLQLRPVGFSEIQILVITCSALLFRVYGVHLRVLQRDLSAAGQRQGNSDATKQRGPWSR